MAGILDGLGNMGLSGLAGMDIYDKPDRLKSVEVEIQEKDEEPPVREEDLLFEKNYSCPVCQESFPALTVRPGKVHRIDSDQDLRPIYEPIDALKYDPIHCPYCGYTNFAKGFSIVTEFQVREVREKITRTYVPQLDFPSVYDYERAFRHYQLALANAIVMRAKTSQRAYICLKAGWILRGQAESLDPAAPGYRTKVETLKKKENEFLRNALEGFISARQKENFPIADMDEVTLEVLTAALSLKTGKLDQAARSISLVLSSKAVNSRIKEKAQEMKEMMLEMLRCRQGG